jgi:hypothetical protein
MVCSSFKNMLSNSQTLRPRFRNRLKYHCRSVWQHRFWTMDTPLFSGHLGAFDTFNVILTITNTISIIHLQAAQNGFQLWCTFTPPWILTYLNNDCVKNCISDKFCYFLTISLQGKRKFKSVLVYFFLHNFRMSQKIKKKWSCVYLHTTRWTITQEKNDMLKMKWKLLSGRQQFSHFQVTQCWNNKPSFLITRASVIHSVIW